MNVNSTRYNSIIPNLRTLDTAWRHYICAYVCVHMHVYARICVHIWIHFLVYYQSNIIGYLIGNTKYLDDKRYAYYISYFYVIEKHRNKKLGSILIQKAIKKCHGLGINFILLSCDKKNPRVNRFYRKHQFVLDPILGKYNPSQNVYCLFL